ncbi:histone H2A [Heterostelium album PN500]|uniref:Histone H2A n=1 Tax=Heterostelium pallidum (strain ATCC 26659 / Pp 5 / PN500) TaxID=670386 RepID=D3BTM8_HETP5|nr:histone H2A [Heterostelium album PN500]EFA75445.1 histone H2A [Heterostelium album PN500]|eukprot:XP_020427579.1 histone H2A [Heterostelium album PN500]
MSTAESAPTKPAAKPKATPAASTTAPAEKRKIPKGKSSKPAQSRSAKAHIVFPVSRIERLLREGRYAPRVESNAPVYLAAVLEYLVIETLELAYNTCHNYGKTRITPQHINWAVGNDLELNQLFQNVTIANGGVIPNSAHLQTKSSKKGKKSTKAEASQGF